MALPKLQPLVATVCNLRELQPRLWKPKFEDPKKPGSKGRLYVYQHLQRGAKWFLKVSIHHPLGFNWHPFEAPGIPGNSAGDLFGMVKT